MEFTVFQTAQEEEKEEFLGTPRKERPAQQKSLSFQFWRLTT